MPQAITEIVLVVHRERIRWDETVILECEAPGGQKSLLATDTPVVSVKVKEEGDLALVPQCSYRFWGSWSEYRGQRQFVAATYCLAQPHNRAGIVRYLAEGPGIGQKRAEVAWEKFSGDAVRICREQPGVAAAALGLTDIQAQQLSVYLVSLANTEQVMIELLELLAGRGFPTKLQQKVLKKYGNAAPRKIRANPYRLLWFKGAGFQRCHQMYLDLGGRPERLRCQAFAAWHAISSATKASGDTWISKDIIIRDLPRLVGSGSRLDPVRAVRLAKKLRLIDTEFINGELWVAVDFHAHNEYWIGATASYLSAIEGKSSWPNVAGLGVSTHQQEEIAKAFAFGRLAILGGGPGTGKTYSAARIIRAIGAKRGLDRVAVAAPTGKAAARISEVMQSYGLDVKATTLHSLLKATPNEDNDDGFDLAGGAFNFDYLVVDESSMVDTNLMGRLMQTIGDGNAHVHLLLVGDTNQLPPIGHGAPLRDLVRAGIPTGTLTEIRRNSGLIVETCHTIRRGEYLSKVSLPARFDEAAGQNLVLLAEKTPESTAARIVRGVNTIAELKLCDPVWDVQVIVPTNAARTALNKTLQAELNPAGEQVDGNPFRVDDKIVCLKNQWFKAYNPDAPAEPMPEYDEEGKRIPPPEFLVANGELGRVIEVGEKWTAATFFSPDRTIKIPRGNFRNADDDPAETTVATIEEPEKADTGCKFDLGYALTCHKAQGSEWPIVFVAVDDSPATKRMGTREWFYTAISRARRCCFVVGDRTTMNNMVVRESLSRRRTLLAEGLKPAIDARESEQSEEMETVAI